MRLRQFIVGLGSAAAAWPLAARAQQPKRVGVLMGSAATDPTRQSQLTAFMQGMSEMPFGWIGIVAVMLVAAGAFALGQIAVFGLEFLTHWPLVLGGWFAGLIVLSAICWY